MEPEFKAKSAQFRSPDRLLYSTQGLRQLSEFIFERSPPRLPSTKGKSANAPSLAARKPGFQPWPCLSLGQMLALWAGVSPLGLYSVTTWPGTDQLSRG